MVILIIGAGIYEFCEKRQGNRDSAYLIESVENIDKKIISKDNRARMVEILEKGRGSVITLFCDNSIPEKLKLKEEFTIILKEAGWKISQGGAEGICLGCKKDHITYRKDNSWKADLVIEALRIIDLDIKKDEPEESLGNTIELNFVI